jgi:hypothetical protein
MLVGLSWRSVRLLACRAGVLLFVLGGTQALVVPRAASQGNPQAIRPNAVGGLDCNGLSTIQRPVRPALACSDPRGKDGGRFVDNGVYIGHDEPDLRFISNQPGSGNGVTFTERLGSDPAALPTVAHPGTDVSNYFQLSIAPWFSMALCDPQSYPLLPCTPNSDANAPKGLYPGGGSAFLEMQFYPPGFAPFVDNISCDNTHWCASLHINSLECTQNFVTCNPKCVEPTNFAFIQTDGVPTGPPSPQLANVASNTPNARTLLMNPGDSIRARIFDTAVPGGHALETSIDDLTTGQHGFMVASAANGFTSTSIVDCSGTPLNFEPEYSSAAVGNVIPWAALQVNISTQFEIGHFTPCTGVSGRATFTSGTFTDKYFKRCAGPYEAAAPPDPTPQELSDAFCFRAGDTHGGAAPPNRVTGCTDVLAQNGDLDFDGSGYWPEWPNSVTPGTYPATFQQQQPVTTGGQRYPSIQFETDVAFAEPACLPTGQNCTVPPVNAPGHFYPYWTQARTSQGCVWEFGQMPNGNDFGKDHQYGAVPPTLGFQNIESSVMPNPNC